MMELKYTPKAREDLQNLREYILENFGNEELMKKVLTDITKAIRNLTVFPYLGSELVK